MKILLRFYLQNNKLPIDYRRIMLSFFKRSLSDIAEGKYYEKYYFTPERRNFTFAVNLPMPKFSKTEIQLGKNQLNITFSTADYNTGCIFMSAFIKQKDKPIPAPLGNEMKLVSVNLMPEKNVTSSSAVVKMLSPLCIRLHKAENNSDKYISVANPDFTEIAKQVIGCDRQVWRTPRPSPRTRCLAGPRQWSRDGKNRCTAGDSGRADRPVSRCPVSQTARRSWAPRP